MLGIAQAVLVVFVVWYSCFWLARKLKVDDEFAAMLSTAVSICGVSAAIAACGAIKGDKKKLSYVTSLVLIVAVPMMIAMPWIAKSTGMNDLVAGAWLGGTLDTSASVVAAGALISDAAMKTGVIVKFSQNALIGVAAFALAIWWALRQGAQTGEKPSAAVIWERFPKFVIGFVIASAIFSFLLSPELVSGTRSALNDIRTWWFALAFVCVGLETRFSISLTTDQGRPALAFLGAQTINVFWTLLLAWLLFGGVLFAQPAIQVRNRAMSARPFRRPRRSPTTRSKSSIASSGRRRRCNAPGSRDSSRASMRDGRRSRKRRAARSRAADGRAADDPLRDRVRQLREARRRCRQVRAQARLQAVARRHGGPRRRVARRA